MERHTGSIAIADRINQGILWLASVLPDVYLRKDTGYQLLLLSIRECFSIPPKYNGPRLYALKISWDNKAHKNEFYINASIVEFLVFLCLMCVLLASYS